MQLLLDFDQAELYQYEQQRELSIRLLKDWLCNYKFKNWSTTQTRKKKVSQQMKTKRASKVAKELNNTKRWHSHSYGISLKELENDIGLQIEDFGKDKERANAIHGYHNLLWDYMHFRGVAGALHSTNSVEFYLHR